MRNLEQSVLARVDQFTGGMMQVNKIVDRIATRIIPQATAHAGTCLSGWNVLCRESCDPDDGSQCGGQAPYVLNYTYAYSASECYTNYVVCPQACSFSSCCVTLC